MHYWYELVSMVQLVHCANDSRLLSRCPSGGRFGSRYTTCDELRLLAIVTVAETLSVLRRCREGRLIAWNTRRIGTV